MDRLYRAVCADQRPHKAHYVGPPRNGDYCVGLDQEFSDTLLVKFMGLDETVKIKAQRVMRDADGRVIWVEDQDELRWNWANHLWTKKRTQVTND